MLLQYCNIIQYYCNIAILFNIITIFQYYSMLLQYCNIIQYCYNIIIYNIILILLLLYCYTEKVYGHIS